MVLTNEPETYCKALHNEAERQEKQRNTDTKKNKEKKIQKIECLDLCRSDWEALIDQWIFSERDRKILKRRLLDGICFEPLAEEFNLSVRQTKSIVYKAQEKLFKHI